MHWLNYTSSDQSGRRTLDSYDGVHSRAGLFEAISSTSCDMECLGKD